jgi:two-component system chemotaxis response regulator CheB
MPNHGYLAPGDIHSRLVSKPGAREQAMFQLSRFPTDTAHSPSVGVGMESCLEMFGDRIIAVMLTGMGDDGADAMVKIKKAGGRTIAEDESTAIVFGMPKEAIRRGGAEFVLPVHKIAEKIIELAAGLKGSLRAEKTTEKKKRFA